jgi:hypothetical protein
MNLQKRKNRLLAILVPLGIYGLSFLGIITGYLVESVKMLDFFSWTLLIGLLSLIISVTLISISDSRDAKGW